MTATSDGQISADPTAQLTTLREELGQEKQRKGTIVPVEARGKPLPIYFNSGCALYNDGLTNLEIAGGKIRLVKWPRLVNAGMAPEVYQEGDLKLLLEEAIGRSIPSAAFLNPRTEKFRKRDHRISKAFATH